MLTRSTMLPLGTSAPDFDLSDVITGKKYSIKDISSNKALLVMFICKHCPFVKHIQNELSKMGRDYEKKDIQIIAISSNSVETHPEDSPKKLKEQAEKYGFTFPYLYDETQEVAKSYTAACTPDFFLFNKQRKLVYRGQLDDSRPGNFRKVTGKDLREAIENTLKGKSVSKDQKPSAGCNIKWHPGKTPEHFK